MFECIHAWKQIKVFVHREKGEWLIIHIEKIEVASDMEPASCYSFVEKEKEGPEWGALSLEIES